MDRLHCRLSLPPEVQAPLQELCDQDALEPFSKLVEDYLSTLFPCGEEAPETEAPFDAVGRLVESCLRADAPRCFFYLYDRHYDRYARSYHARLVSWKFWNLAKASVEEQDRYLTDRVLHLDPLIVCLVPLSPLPHRCVLAGCERPLPTSSSGRPVGSVLVQLMGRMAAEPRDSMIRFVTDALQSLVLGAEGSPVPKSPDPFSYKIDYHLRADPSVVERAEVSLLRSIRLKRPSLLRSMKLKRPQGVITQPLREECSSVLSRFLDAFFEIPTLPEHSRGILACWLALHGLAEAFFVVVGAFGGDLGWLRIALEFSPPDARSFLQASFERLHDEGLLTSEVLWGERTPPPAPLELLVRHGDPELLEWVLSRVPDLGAPPVQAQWVLHEARKQNDPRKVGLLLRYCFNGGVEVDPRRIERAQQVLGDSVERWSL